MITLDQCYLVTTPIDMRYGAGKLTEFIQLHFTGQWNTGGVFLFMNKTRTRARLIRIDAHGTWLCHRQLHQGSFSKVMTNESHYLLTEAQFEWLVKGIDFRKIEGLSLDNFL